MKLRNKKTREIADFNNFYKVKETGEQKVYSSLAELNAEWEDVEEPKTFWAISWAGEPEEYDAKKTPQELKDMAKEISNYFESLEEAEKAVEKLKAWKRLKDKGFRFNKWTIPEEPKTPHIKLVIEAEIDVPDSPYDLDLLFNQGDV